MTARDSSDFFGSLLIATASHEKRRGPALLALILLAGSAGAAEPDVPPPVAFGGELIADYSSVASGGLEGNDAARGLLRLGVGFDLEHLLGWKGASAFFGLQSFRGDHGSLRVGDAQGFSNIDAWEHDYVGEAWIEQRLSSARTRIRVGRLDANQEFAAVGSAGFSPTITWLPTYPLTSAGAVVRSSVVRWLNVGAGLLQSPSTRSPVSAPGNPLFGIGELDFGWPGRDRLGHGRLAIGVWRDTTDIRTWTGELVEQTEGAYAVFEQAIGPATAFVQLGHTPEGMGPFRGHAGVGASGPSPIPGRVHDRVGLMLSRVRLSAFEEESTYDRETVLELFYRFETPIHIAVQPDLQYVVNPAIGHALVATLRVHAMF